MIVDNYDIQNSPLKLANGLAHSSPYQKSPTLRYACRDDIKTLRLRRPNPLPGSCTHQVCSNLIWIYLLC